MLERLRRSLLEAPVFKRGEYDYFIHPITDGVPEIRPDLIREVTANIVRIANLDVDKIVTVEAMGIPHRHSAFHSLRYSPGDYQKTQVRPAE